MKTDEIREIVTETFDRKVSAWFLDLLNMATENAV